MKSKLIAAVVAVCVMAVTSLLLDVAVTAEAVPLQIARPGTLDLNVFYFI